MSDNSPKPIIYQLSLARSGSTASLRCFEAQNLFDIYHEPTVRPYELKHRPQIKHFWFNSNNKMDTYDDVKSQLLRSSLAYPVYVKDMIYSSVDWMCQDVDWMTNPNVHFLFLVRDPYDQLVSFYRKCGEMSIGHFMGGMANVYDYNILLKSIQNCLHYAPDRTLVITADQFYEYPNETMNFLLNSAKISVPDLKLTWAPKPDNFDGFTWHESKRSKFFKLWHNDAVKSTGFGTLNKYPRDYSQFKNCKWAQSVIDSNWPAYQQILSIVDDQRMRNLSQPC